MKNESVISTGDGVYYGGSLHVISGGPGMEKTIFALQCAAEMVKKSGKSIYIFSTEIPLDYLKENFEELCAQNSIILDDTAPVALSQIRETLSGISGLGAAVIDYFQLLQSVGGTWGQNAAVSAEEITRELKLIAEEFDIPVIWSNTIH